MAEFAYSPMFPLAADDTEYERISGDHVELVDLGGETFLKVAPEALRLLANLASSSEGQAVVLDADGVVNAAMAALQAHASETEVQQEALRLLAKASPF